MNCETCRTYVVEELLPAKVGISDRKMYELVNDHLSQCDDCSALIAELLETYAAVPLALDPIRPSDRFQRCVLDRIVVEQELPKAAPVVSPSGNRQQWLSYALAASVLIVLVGGLWRFLGQMEHASLASNDPSKEESVRLLERSVAEMKKLQEREQSQSGAIRYVSFTAQPSMPKVGNQPNVAAHAILDSRTGQVHFFGFDMPELEAHESFVIWFVSDVAHFGAHFRPTKEGLANTVVELPRLGRIAPVFKQIVISVESKERCEAPSDRVWLKADF